MEARKYTAVVLAGDRGAMDAVAEAAGVTRKALAVVGGRPMLAHVLDALGRSQGVGDILVVANGIDEIRAGIDLEALPRAGDITFMEGAGSPVTSVQRVIGTRQGIFPLLVVTADNPLITAAAVEKFLEAAREARSAKVVVALATKTAFRKQFPEAPRTFVKLGREGYSGCNIFALKSPKALLALDFWRKIERQRKKALRLVAAFGFWSLVRVFFGWMDLIRAFERVSEVLGVIVEPYLVEDPLLAMDVDLPEHLELVEECLAAKRK